MEKVDYKKLYKDLYQPKTTPSLIEVGPIPYIMIDGKGNPNEEGGAYQQAVGLLYALSFTIKMSKMGKNPLPGYFDYVVPPLEGFWNMADGKPGVDYQHKEQFVWTSLIRQPDFVTPEIFAWACKEVTDKKGLNTTKAQFTVYNEGLCVQCMHIGPYDNEPATVAKMEAFLQQNGYVYDFKEDRRHHEIYLGDPRKGDPLKTKTIIRHPIRLL